MLIYKAECACGWKQNGDPTTRDQATRAFDIHLDTADADARGEKTRHVGYVIPQPRLTGGPLRSRSTPTSTGGGSA